MSNDVRAILKLFIVIVVLLTGCNCGTSDLSAECSAALLAQLEGGESGLTAMVIRTEPLNPGVADKLSAITIMLTSGEYDEPMEIWCATKGRYWAMSKKSAEQAILDVLRYAGENSG